MASAGANMLTAADLRSTQQAEMSPVWDYDKRSAEVDAERLQNVERNRPLAQAPVKPHLDDPRATATQLELFELVGRDTYDFVEQLIRRLPSLRQREHFRKLYLREYHGVQDDGSLAFAFGERQRFHANTFLRELIESRLNKVFEQYQFDLSWLSMSMAEKWQWAMEQGVAYRDAINAGDGVIREREGDTGKNRLPFYLMTENKLKVVGHDLSYIFSKIQTDFFTEQANSGKNFDDAACDSLLVSLYRRLGLLSEKIGLSLPYWATFSFRDGDDDFVPNQKSIEIALNKSACETYWFKALRKSQRQMVEHLAIACGEVRKGVAAFISDKSFGEWRAQKKKNFDFLNGMILQNVEDEDEQVELIKMYERSSTNPSIRYQEMMNCLNGIEQWADENNHQALFLTLTAPSSFHAQHSKGGENKKWSGASPKQTQAYLNKVWAQYRAILKKRAIKFYGMRVAEPHHDGTPHWHLLVYVAKDHAETVAEIFRKKALEVDGDERGASQHRCKVEFCDKQKGSATAYIVKYISKNLGGTKDRGYISDEIDGLSFRDNASRVRAWASWWGIRQFQFYGVSSIGVWRELRRLCAGQVTDPTLEKVRLGADVSDYAFYLDQQGGGGATRDEWKVKLVYEDMGENKYGQVRKRVVGVRNVLKQIGEWVKTRIKKWVKIPKKLLNKSNTAEHGSAANNTERSSAWTCVSNCNPSHGKGSGDSYDDIRLIDDEENLIVRNLTEHTLLKALKQRENWIKMLKFQRRIRFSTVEFYALAQGKRLPVLDVSPAYRQQNTAMGSMEHTPIPNEYLQYQGFDLLFYNGKLIKTNHSNEALYEKV